MSKCPPLNFFYLHLLLLMVLVRWARALSRHGCLVLSSGIISMMLLGSVVQSYSVLSKVLPG